MNGDTPFGPWYETGKQQNIDSKVTFLHITVLSTSLHDVQAYLKRFVTRVGSTVSKEGVSGHKRLATFHALVVALTCMPQ
jgi:hypothetical protein